MTRPKPVMLMILDGWGLRRADQANAVSLANTPVLDSLKADYANTRLRTSGKAVGLPEGIMGNSEVGHLNIGAGRIVYQDLLRIDNAIRDGAFFENQAINRAMDRALEADKALHLIGLVSDGGVHSQLTHLLALLDLAKRKGMTKVFVHAILDGRDTAPDGGRDYIAQVQRHVEAIGTGAIASICGRFYAMDRDTRWDRTEQAYQLYTQGSGLCETDPVAAVRSAYTRGETDEFVKPIALTDKQGNPLTRLQDGDAVIFFNFRADRARQITRALTQNDFDGFARPGRIALSDYVCMALYEEQFDLPVAFPPERLKNILGQVVSNRRLHQLRIAETEKYAHVTYFFNGGEETPFDNEDRCLVPSPRDIPTYDHKPEMSAFKVTEEVLQRIASDKYDLIILNFANMDMVGHTGIIEAAVKAVETVDQCVGRIVDAVRAKAGAILITADHGNAETMREENGKSHTAHTTNPVPLILVDDSRKDVTLAEGILADIAPTILSLMDVPKPEEMTGQSLIKATE